MRVRQVMTADPVWIEASADLAEAVRLMHGRSVSCLLVCDCTGAVVGIVTDRSLLKALATHPGALYEVAVGAIAEPVPITVRSDERAASALELMSAYGQRRLAVVDDGRLVGILTRSDLARWMPVDDVGRLLLDLATA